MTIEALATLTNLLDLTQRTDAQLKAVSAMMRQVCTEIDRVLESADQAVTEMLAESTTGTETSFALQRGPALDGTLKVYVNGALVAAASYTFDGTTITPLVPVPAGSTITATYTVAGLMRQVTTVLEVMDDLDAQYFLTRRDAYLIASAWIEAH